MKIRFEVFVDTHDCGGEGNVHAHGDRVRPVEGSDSFLLYYSFYALLDGEMRTELKALLNHYSNFNSSENSILSLGVIKKS